MYTAKIIDPATHQPLLELRSDNRNYMRNLELLCGENKLTCVTTVEVAPRVVTFKGVDPFAGAAAAKADAKADMKATEGK